jgi:outer membrane lipoprotein SlyB
MGFTTILQCDLKRTLTINEKTKTYMVSSTDRPNAPGAAGDERPTNTTPTTMPNEQTPTRGGVVNITNKITDTGERKEMFGFTARRIKTSMVKEASPDACDKNQKVETDGWYIDFEFAFECPGQTQKTQAPPVQSRPGCKDDVRVRTIGSAKLGFPLHVTTTIYQPDGQTSTMTQEVLELSREPLSASLFDVPEGYALAKDMQELYGMGGATTSSASNRPPASSTTSENPVNTTASTAGTPNNSGPKKPGVIRIGLIVPKVQVNAGNPAQTAEAVRNGFAQYLKGPTVEVMPLTARLPSEAIEEARRSQCDYVLHVSMTVKKGGGGSMFGRAIGNIAGSAAGHIPGGGSAATGAARSAAITGVYTTAAVTANIKAKDELSLEYKLDQTENSNAVLTNTGKAKAKSDGEDILTPLIESAAQTIISTIRR